MENLLNIIWPEVTFDEGENPVRCIYHDDDRASAHLNLDGDSVLYHCKVCDQGKNALQLAQDYFKTDAKNANRLLGVLNKAGDLFDWKQKELELEHKQAAKDVLRQFHISDKTLSSLHAGYHGGTIAFPITIDDKIIDIRTYNPSQQPKVRSLNGAIAGTLFPQSAFKYDQVVLVEGEKDVATMHELGFDNTATVVGGSQSMPNKTPLWFDNKKVYIMYDNDEAGQKGAAKVAHYLLTHPDISVEVKLVDIKLLINKDKGDVTDAIMAGKVKADVLNALKAAKKVAVDDVLYVAQPRIKEKSIKLSEADKFTRMNLVSKIQIAAAFDSSYTIPKNATVGGTPWVFDPTENLEQLLDLVDTPKGDNALKGLICPQEKEADVALHVSNDRIPVYKVTVASTMSDVAGSDRPQTEHSALCIGKPLDSGKEYRIHYQLVPNKNNRSIALIYQADDLSEESNQFKITSEVKALFDKWSGKTFEENINQAKGLINANFNDKLLKTLELMIHSVDRFDFGRVTDIKGSVDVMSISDTGAGKSVTTQGLLKAYDQGARASLAGSAATTQGLIGGSKAVGSSGAYQTTAGLIPRMNGSFIVLEELAKNNGTIIKDLTDIRTSGVAEITRVSGKISLPANVRMAFLSNPKSGKDGTNKSVDSYPNGVEIVQDLLGAREDIGRFDLITVLGTRELVEMDPTWEAPQHFPLDYLRMKLNWVWTRKPNQIVYDKGVVEYIAKDATKILNDKFESDVQIFGRKTWMKLAKVSIAIAGYRGSHTPDYESILVTMEDVKAAMKLFDEIYDNPTFKLKEQVAEEKSYTTPDEGSTDVLTRQWNVHNQIIQQLALVSEIQTRELQTVSSLDATNFNEVISELTLYKLIRNVKGKILPTEKFRVTLDKIKKQPQGMFPKTAGEESLNE